MFLAPDLTPTQRKAAFELRVERRRKEAAGEENLVIRKGKIVAMSENIRNQDDCNATIEDYEDDEVF